MLYFLNQENECELCPDGMEADETLRGCQIIGYVNFAPFFASEIEAEEHYLIDSGIVQIILPEIMDF